jgi:adenylosuccinate lyase
VRAALSDAEIAANFDLAHHTRHVDAIFGRVFGPS